MSSIHGKGYARHSTIVLNTTTQCSVRVNLKCAIYINSIYSFNRVHLWNVKFDLHDHKKQLIDHFEASDLYMISHISKVAQPSLFKQFVKELVLQKKYDDEEGQKRLLRWIDDSNWLWKSNKTWEYLSIWNAMLYIRKVINSSALIYFRKILYNICSPFWKL